MHKVAEPRNAADASTQAGPEATRASSARVAVAGATGYTGEELLRLLARHPAVTIAAAMSSGQPGSTARPLPALAHLWDGAVVPLSADALKNDADVVFLALP